MNKCQYIAGSTDVLDTCYQDMVAALKEHGTISIEWKRKGQTRSISQNNLYWMWMQELCDYVEQKKQVTYTQEEMSHKCKMDFGFYYTKQIGEKEYKDIPKSTATAEKGELFFFMEKVDAWASNSLRCYLTKPENSVFMQLREYQHAV